MSNRVGDKTNWVPEVENTSLDRPKPEVPKNARLILPHLEAQPIDPRVENTCLDLDAKVQGVRESSLPRAPVAPSRPLETRRVRSLMLLLKWLCTRFVSAIKKLRSRNHAVYVRRPKSDIVGEGKEEFIIRALNGMNTRYKRHLGRVTSWAAVHKQPVRYTYSPTGGFIKDTFGVIAIKQGRKSRTAVHVKGQLIKDLATGKNVVFVAHSRGTIQAEKALRSIYKERPDLLERLYVIGVGGARRIGAHLGKYVLNIVATNDPIANLAEKRKRYRYNVLSVRSPESVQFDHSLEGSTYKSAVHEVIDRLRERFTHPGKLAL